MIPSAGPSFGRLIDQAAILRRYKFPCVMALPCGDPRDAAGLGTRTSRVRREMRHAAGSLSERRERTSARTRWRASMRWRGWSQTGRVSGSSMLSFGVSLRRMLIWRRCWTESTNRRCQRNRRAAGDCPHEGLVASGIHHRLGVCCSGRQSGSVRKLRPPRTFRPAESFRSRFLPLEDLRDAWGPARVLHAATELSGIATTGPIPPFMTSAE